MIGILVIIGASFLLFRMLGGAPRLRLRRHQPMQATAAKIEELTEYASRLRAVKKYTSAEKVYLEILKLDHRHAQTYSRLGTLYSAQKNYADAIECFQIATQLSPSGATFYNLGLGYYENRNPMKAIAAFEKAVMFEPSVQRHVGLAKAHHRLGDTGKMVTALEQAAQLEPDVKVLWLLAEAYEQVGRSEDHLAVLKRIYELDPKNPRLKSSGFNVRKARAAAK